MKNALIVAELLGIVNPLIRPSCYAGWEICWTDNENNFRIITFVSGGTGEFCYTKDCNGLPGTWSKVDYWFLYLS